MAREFSVIKSSQVTLLILLALTASIFALSKLITDFEIENNYLKRIIPVFFIYELIIIARGLPFDSTGIKEILQSDYLFWIYLIPLFIFFDKDLVTIAYLMDAIYFLGIVFLLVCIVHPTFILYRSTAEVFIHPFAFGCGFLLLNARYLSKKKRAVAFLSLLVGAVSFTYLARRNGIVSYGGLIFASLALAAKNISASKFFRIFPLLAGIVVIGLLFTDYLPATLTDRLNSRLTEDSRSYVFDNLFADMEDDMIFGKGMKGLYYSPMGGGGANADGVEFAEVEYRNIIENGYLQQYLNGGIVYISLFLLVLLPAVFLGIYKSQNQFTQACAILVFLWLLDMFIFGLPRITLQYVLVWICAGICYKSSIREKSNEEISDVFLNYKEYENTLVY